MAHDPNCIFCKIIEGQIPSAKVYEDEHVLAFLDISQVTKGHTLVIPKNHHKDLFELPAETAAHLYSVVPKIARAIQTVFQPTALNTLNNNGRAAGQTVFHFHMHLIPRYGVEDGFGLIWEVHDSEYTPEKLQQISGAIAGAIKEG
ncbi:HIT family protein [Aneurinibacillus sp. Ricciae_BoGa-3]|uniref:HIT family protein n=1 Tax=Aneurinibacillus sp. Ricciae_BoGa-3 TaxID=3022697 RepID=UPI00233F7BDC|nr:HIT family protein [Aneurinibacillus sp. Ricciae_BoGa-3]WCK56007.1 HIT family protein [Aneurinibacillus sp. Ricciae_BoGa-3]